MDSEILVSVISRSYNHEEYIEQAILGFINQKTNFKYEIIIADDNSTDGTQKIISDYATKYPDLIFPILREENIGPRKNDIDSLSRAKGKYVAVCEGDDFWIDENKLQMQVDFLENNPDFGLVHTDNDILYDGSGKLIHSMNKQRNDSLVNHEDPLHGLLSGNYMIHTLTVMVRREHLFKAIRSDIFQIEKYIQGDLILWLEILGHAKVHYIPKVTAVYRLRGGSLSRQRSSIKQIEYQESSKKIRMLYTEKYNVPEDVRKKVEQMYNFVILTRSYYKNDKVNAENSFKKIHQKDLKSMVLYYGTKYSFLKLLIEPVRLARIAIVGMVNSIQGKRD